MKFNNRGPKDTRNLLSGKDGAIFSEDGEQLTSATAFQISMNVTNANYNPLGDAQTHKHLLSYELSATITEAVIETSQFMKDLMEMAQTGVPCMWTFQTTMAGWDDSEEKYVFYDCVPDGQIDVQNAQVGELWTRTWNLFINAPPELIKKLTARE